MMSQTGSIVRAIAVVVVAVVCLSACKPGGEQDQASPSAPPSTAEAVAERPTGVIGANVATETNTVRGTQHGVALTPKSYEGSDLPDFLELVDGSVDLLMHAGDWAELADDTSAFRVLSELAAAQDTEVMIVLSPSNGTGLIRPLDDATIDSYLASLTAYVETYKPRYLGLGNELNLVQSRDMADFDQTVALWERALPIVREHSPETEVFVTFQYEWLLGQRGGWFGRTNDPSAAQWDLLGRFAGADAVGITTYPGLVAEHPSELALDYYSQIADHTALPVLITEAGWSADPDQQQLPGSEAEQVAFIELLHDQPARLDVVAMVWTFVYATQVREPAFADMGLVSDDDRQRPAWTAWTEPSAS